MHLAGVPVAVIAAWIGHKDASLAMRRYAHSQDNALNAVVDTFSRVETMSWHRARESNSSNAVRASCGGADDGNRTGVFSLGSVRGHEKVPTADRKLN